MIQDSYKHKGLRKKLVDLSEAKASRMKQFYQPLKLFPGICSWIHHSWLLHMKTNLFLLDRGKPFHSPIR